MPSSSTWLTVMSNVHLHYHHHYYAFIMGSCRLTLKIQMIVVVVIVNITGGFALSMFSYRPFPASLWQSKKYCRPYFYVIIATHNTEEGPEWSGWMTCEENVYLGTEHRIKKQFERRDKSAAASWNLRSHPWLWYCVSLSLLRYDFGVEFCIVPLIYKIIMHKLKHYGTTIEMSLTVLD